MSEHDPQTPGEDGQTSTTGQPPAETPGAVASPPTGDPTAFAPPPPVDEDPSDLDEALGGEPVPEERTIAEEGLSTEAPPTDDDHTALEAEQAAAEHDDPFAGWPQAETADEIEEKPEEGASVEHAAGELDVPNGYTVLEGTPTGQRRSVAVVVSRYNGGLTNRMLARAIEALEEAGVSADAVTIMPVPGAFELPLAAMALAKTRRYACVVALGAIVRGETPHFDYIASEAASGLQLAAIETGVPVAFGVLTVENRDQAEARIDRAADAVQTALEMADVFAQLRASART
jgi:6,7-dimethyl-8-ribityllumazine synthase